MYKILEFAKKIKTTWNSSIESEVSGHSGAPVVKTTRCNPTTEVICGPCAEGESLDRQIHETEEALTTLKATRASNNIKINTVHDPLSRLPVELVFNIFLYLRPLPMEVAYHLDVNKPDDVAKSMKTPLLLGAVCRAWRAFAWSIPRLWSTISVNVYNEHPDVPDLIRQWLARSGQLPLYVYLYTARRRLDGGVLSPHPYGNEPYVERLIDAVNEYSARWFYLNLDIPKRFMMRVHCNGLEATKLDTLTLQMLLDDNIEDAEFDMYQDTLKFGISPRLRKIYIAPSLTFYDIDINWQSLSDVQGSYATIEDCCRLLCDAPALTCLTLADIVVDAYELDELSSTIFRHQNLVSLQINGGWSDEGPDTLLSYLDLPALEDLGIFANYSSKLYAVNDFLKRSSCILKSFKLNIAGSWMEHKKALIALLDKMPCLETLHLECQYSQFSNEGLASQLPTPTAIHQMESISGRLFLPNLKKVHIELRYLPEGYSLDLLLRSKFPNIVPSPPGRSSHIHSTITDSDAPHLMPLYIYYLLDIETQRRLLPVIESGFEIDTFPKDLYPFVDFLRHTLDRHVSDPGLQLKS